MAVPKRKTSTSRRNMRRAHDRLVVAHVSECPQCGELVRPHHLCSACGSYQKKTILSPKAKSSDAASSNKR